MKHIDTIGHNRKHIGISINSIVPLMCPDEPIVVKYKSLAQRANVRERSDRMSINVAQPMSR